jgi:hypothetical protein
MTDVDSAPADEEDDDASKASNLTAKGMNIVDNANEALETAKEMINQELPEVHTPTNPNQASAQAQSTVPNADNPVQNPYEKANRLRQKLRERQAAARRGGKPHAVPIGPRRYPLPGREFTPTMPEVPEPQKHLRYYDLRVYLYESDDPRGHLWDRLDEMLQKLFKHDETIKFYPYLEENREGPIEAITKDTWEGVKEADSIVYLQRYFHKIIEFFRRGGWQTVRVLMTHKEEFETIIGECGAWLQNNFFGLYIKSLQVEESIVVGWAYMSVEKINRDEFAEELSQWCGFPVGLQWRNVAHNGESNRTVKALHFDVEKRYASADRRVLGSLYEWKRKSGWPFGVRLRFVPEMRHGATKEAKQSCLRLRRKQANIVAFTKHYLHEGLHAIDHVSAAIGNISVRQFLANINSFAQFRANPYTHCRRDMIIIAFFYLLRAGEYTVTNGTASTPFRYCDVDLWHNNTRLDIASASDDMLLSATASFITFTNQKNGVRNEKIGHGITEHPIINPTAALARRIVHLRANNAPPTTPLATYYLHPNKMQFLHSKHISHHLKLIATFFGTPLGFTASDVSAHSLRSGGATALFCAGVPIEKIRLMGRWQSDTVFRYIHVQALPSIDALAQQMLIRGTISFVPAPSPLPATT